MSLRSELEAAVASLNRAIQLLPPDSGPGPGPVPGPGPIGANIIRPGASSPALVDALASAQPGDIIALDKTWRYEGNFVFRGSAVGPPVILATENNIPERRITPSDAGTLATLSAGNGAPALEIEGGGNLTMTAVNVLSQLHQDEVIVCQGAKNITIDRVLIQAEGDCKRGIRGNGEHIIVSRSHIAGIVRQGQDSQAFCAWEGRGPYTLRNNYLAGSGENVMFGGADNLGGEGTNPSDILIEDCHIHKPEAWRQILGSVKNLLELKNATRVVIRNNLFEGTWTDAQSGFSILFTAMNQDGRAPWTTVRDVLFERNLVRNVERGLNISGGDYGHVTQPSTNIIVRKNVVIAQAHFMQAQREIDALTVEDNVSENGFNILTLEKGDIRDSEDVPRRPAEYAVKRFKFNRNYAWHNEYGVIGGPIGTAALNANCQEWEFNDNKFVGLMYAYPEGTKNITHVELDAAKQALLAQLGWS